MDHWKPKGPRISLVGEFSLYPPWINSYFTYNSDLCEGFDVLLTPWSTASQGEKKHEIQHRNSLYEFMKHSSPSPPKDWSVRCPPCLSEDLLTLTQVSSVSANHGHNDAA